MIREAVLELETEEREGEKMVAHDQDLPLGAYWRLAPEQIVSIEILNV
jgi:hypothetical protein